MKSPLILRLLQAVLQDVARLEPDVKGLDRDYITIKARFEHEGSGFLSVALSSLCDAVDYGLTQGLFACPTGFSKSQRGALPKLLSGLLCKVFDPRTGSLKEDCSIAAIKNLRQVLRLFKKFNSSSGRNDLLHLEAVGTFWEQEQACRGSFDPLRASMLSCVSGLTLPGLHEFRAEQVFPKHGPGAVRERLAANQKWVATTASMVTDAALDRYALDLVVCANRTAEEVLLDYSRGFTRESQEQAPNSRGSHGLSLGGSAKLISVAKNSTSRRTITVEPCLNMFIQQGLNTELRRQIEACPVLKNSLALTDQRYNQYLALEGSRTGEWTTIDLSAASDRLSYELVKVVFERYAEFFSCVDQCRSEFVEHNSAPRKLMKFAGMGNALTFPVQSCVFANIAICAILFSEGYSAPSVWDVRRTSKVVRVYGDDIIVPTRYSRQVIDWVESFGLKVNQKKTFSEGYFRESCGLDAYRGYDVTPVYFRVDSVQSPVDPDALGAWVSTSNQLWDVGLYHASNCLRDAVEEVLGPLSLVSRDSASLGWTTRCGASDAQRWDRDLHYPMIRAPVIVPVYKKDKLDGLPALFKFFLTPLIQRGQGHLERSTQRFKTKIAWRWMPAKAGTSYLDRVTELVSWYEKDQWQGANPVANLLPKKPRR